MSRPDQTCNLCNKPVFSRGWCSMHYNRWRRHGDPTITLIRQPSTEPYEAPEDGFWGVVQAEMDRRFAYV